MLISIIIPVYKVENYVRRCLLSILNQTYQNIECILVDDCTPDHSMEIIQSLLTDYAGPIRFKIIKHLVNKGLSAARNTGFRHAIGDYVYFLDSDDEITNNAIEILADLVGKYHPDFVIGNVVEEYNNSFSNTNYLQVSKEFIEKDVDKLYARQHWYTMAWNKLVNRLFLIQQGINFYEGIVHEDCLWSFLLAIKAKSMAVCFVPTYIYHRRDLSIMSQVSVKNLNDMLVIIREMNKELILNKNSFLCASLRSLCFTFLIMSKKNCSEFDEFRFYVKQMRGCILPQVKYTIPRSGFSEWVKAAVNSLPIRCIWIVLILLFKIGKYEK